MKRRTLLLGLVFAGSAGGFIRQTAAQETNTAIRAPDPVIRRPGGDNNRSQYEYAPESQPTLRYDAPGSELDACYNETDLLRDQISQLQQLNYEITEKLRIANNRLSALASKE